MRESNSHQRFWRPLSYHLTNPLAEVLRLQNCIHKRHSLIKIVFLWPRSSCSVLYTTLSAWSSPHPISNSQLHALLHFHLRPIYLIVSEGVYSLRMGYLILRGASRLDAFSVYPFQTWLPGHRPGGLTGTPEVCPSRSSRTKDSSSQISCARAG